MIKIKKSESDPYVYVYSMYFSKIYNSFIHFIHICKEMYDVRKQTEEGGGGGN